MVAVARLVSGFVDRLGKKETQPIDVRRNEWRNPGPDLTFQDAVIGSQTFMSTQNNCIFTSRRARAGRLTIYENDNPKIFFLNSIVG